MRRTLFVALVATGAFGALVQAQDAIKTNPTHYHLLGENASVRVVHVAYAPGEKSVVHSHPDAAIIALGNTKVRFTTPDGKSTDSEFANETATLVPAGTHIVTNMGGTVDGILVEFKTAAPGKATIPASRPGLVAKVLADGPRATVIRSTADATFSEPAGTKHDFDQVVIALGTGTMSLSIDGKPAKTAWKRGEIAIIPRGTAHESKNTGGKPIDFVIVAIK